MKRRKTYSSWKQQIKTVLFRAIYYHKIKRRKTYSYLKQKFKPVLFRAIYYQIMKRWKIYSHWKQKSKTVLFTKRKEREKSITLIPVIFENLKLLITKINYRSIKFNFFSDGSNNSADTPQFNFSIIFLGKNFIEVYKSSLRFFAKL